MDSSDSYPIFSAACSRIPTPLDSAATSPPMNKLTFSQHQSSLISMSLDGQPNYAVVNSHLMNMVDKASHRLEAGLMGPQTGDVLLEPLDELRILTIFDRCSHSSGPNTLP